MLGRVLDGKKMAETIKSSLKRNISSLSAYGKIKLIVVTIGDNPSSRIYMSAQKRVAGALGIEYRVKKYPVSVSQGKLEAEIERLNKDNSVTGLIVQAPVPKKIDIEKLLSKIAPEKDAEGLNPSNIGRLAYEKWTVAPSTASACLYLIESTGVKLEGKEAVIVGHSPIVGKPLALMLLKNLATTTVCHVGTYRRGLLKEHVKRAEILVVAVGKGGLIKGSWVKKNAIVIDVGINPKDGRITGDVEFANARKRAAYITPVPGGVGPVTTIMLMKNLVELYKVQRKKR